jgi:hypothetical protein
MIPVCRFTGRYDLYRPTIQTKADGSQSIIEPETATASQQPCIFTPGATRGAMSAATWGMNIEYDAELRVPFGADLLPQKKGQQADHVLVNGRMFVVLHVADAAGAGAYFLALLREREPS